MGGRSGVAVLAILSIALGLLLFGCESALQPPGSVPVRVRVTAIDSGAPQPGVKLLLIDLGGLRPLATPFTTGSDGLWIASLPAAGRFQLLAYPGAGRGIFTLPGPIAPADSLRAGLFHRQGTLRGAQGDTLELSVTTWTGPATADRLPRISGTIVAADTGAPLAGAFVGTPLTPFLDDLAGMVGIDEDVSDAQGRFHVAGIPFARDPDAETIRQVVPLLVERDGYAPAAWTYLPPTGSLELDITGVVIALAPLAPGGPAGSVRGKVAFGGRPLSGLAVGVAFYGATAPAGPAAPVATAGGGPRSRLAMLASSIPAPEPAAALVPGRVARTDVQGRFAIEGLPPGRYVVHPAFERDDGWTYTGVGPAVTVTAGAPADAGVRPVVRTILPARPLPGATLTDTLPYSWSAVAEADSYVVFVDGHLGGVVAAPSWPPPPGPARAGGPHLLQVLAFTRADTVVGAMEYGVRFLLALPAPAR